MAHQESDEAMAHQESDEAMAHGRSRPETAARPGRMRGAAALLAVMLAAAPVAAAAQDVTMPGDEAGWQALWRALQANPYLLAAAGPERALPILVEAVRTRPDGVLWAAYGPGLCGLDAVERQGLAGAARREAFQGSRACLEAMLAALPAAPSTPEARMVGAMYLHPLAESLIETGDLDGADAIAVEVLDDLDGVHPAARGDRIFDMNEVRGRVALRRGDVPAAVGFLHEAAATPGSPALDSFGPRFTLARELLEAGEPEAVLAFLDAVAAFWRGPDAEAERTAARRAIEAGRIPDGPRWR